MKSKIIKMYDVDQAIGEYAWNPVIDEGHIQEKMYMAALEYKCYTPVDTVEENAIVEIRMESSNPKFNRKCKILVGKKMFDKEFEDSLVGKKLNQKYEYDHSKGFKVSYVIDSVQILFVNPLTDEQAVEQAKKHNYPDIHTAEDYREYLVTKEKRKDILSKTRDFLYNFYPSKCEFEMDESDMEDWMECEMNRCREISKSMGLVFDDMKGKELEAAVGCSTIPQFKKMVHGIFLPVLKIDLVAKEFFKTEENVDYENRYELYNRMVYYIADTLCGPFKEDEE